MERKRRKVLFFTRGRGRGHAIPDLSIAEELGRQAPDLDLKFASYSTGGETLREAGHEIIDLKLPDLAPHHPALIRASQAIINARPDVVVSHEEFPALPAAKIFGLPTAFIVDFFPTADIWQDCLRYADRIIFIERQGIFAEPEEAKGKIRYVGPVLRPLAIEPGDRAQMRQKFGVSAKAVVVSVIPGAWATEQRAPIFDLVVPAFEALPFAEKRLIWVAGSDQAEISRRLDAREGARRDVVVLAQCSPVEKLMLASDLCITKANRGTTIDVARLGVPSLSLSFGLNRLDEAITTRIHSNLTLDVNGIDSRFLAGAIQTVLAAAQVAPFPPSAQYRESSAALAAAEISAFVAGAVGPAPGKAAATD
jgi:UDP-N-acetylglucosamine:LPS N-acetylglucosamine transferase